jgi:hypothetical protein
MKASYYKNLLMVLMCLGITGCGKPELVKTTTDLTAVAVLAG